ncbi:hypothetical protein LMG33818_001080 [Halomonadaceae bacterium LMG 33818]|uniref:DUF4870 family protein n=1 Tax=Cernens ardua TaxID=3402176 RepID=UPI003EDC706F
MNTSLSENTPYSDNKQDITPTVRIIYVLYLIGLAVGISSVVGCAMAYIYRGNSAPYLEEHLRFQRRTFWISLLYGIIVAVLSIIVIGYVLIPFLYLWIIVRCIRGWKALDRRESPSKLASWLY